MAKNTIYSGGGKLYFERLMTDGTHAPKVYFGKTDSIMMSTNVDWKEHDNTEGCTALLDARIPAKKSVTVKFDTAEVSVDMLNRAMLGNIIETTQAAGTDVAVVIDGALVEKGAIVDIKKYNVTGLIVKNSDDSVTYTEGTDYTFESKSGFITIIEGGTIATGGALNLTLGTVPAQTVKTVAAMKNSELAGRFTVVTASQTANNYMWIFKKLSVTQDGDFTIKGTEIGKLSFSGTALVSGAETGTLSDYLDIIQLDSADC